MNKMIFFGAAAFCCSLGAVVPDIQFSFNNSLRADFGGKGQRTEEAVGNYGAAGVECKQLSGSDREIKKQLLPGISGAGLKLGNSSDGKSRQIYSYNVSKAVLSPAQGGISFWIKPLSWDGKDKNFHNFISLRGTTRLFINYTPKREISFSLNEGKKVSVINKSAAKWQQGAWHHIAAAWDKKFIRLYIDGALAGAMENNVTSTKPFQLLNLSEYWAGDPGNSVMDDLLIFSKTLSEDKVKKIYDKHKARLLSNAAPLEITVRKKTVKIDGEIGKDEYSFSAEGFRTVSKTSCAYAAIQNRWFCAWDEENFYIALSAPAGKLKAAATARDGHVYSDDCMEFFIQHPENKKVFQLIFNSLGTIYDSFGGDPAWNCQNLRCKSRVKNGIWQLETAIPWKSLGLTAADGTRLRMNLCRSVTTPPRGLSIVTLPNNAYNDPPHFAGVTLKTDSPELHLGSFGKLFDGRLATAAEVKTFQKDKITLAFEVDSQLQPFQFRKTVSFAGSGKKIIPVRGVFRQNNTLDITVVSDKHGILYRTGLEVKEASPARYSYIYTDLKKQEIVIVCENAIAGGEKSRLQVTLKPAGKNNIVYNKTLDVPNDKLVVQCRFPLGDLPCGEYLLEHYLMDRSGSIYARDWEYYGRFSGKEKRFNAAAGLDDTVPAPFTPPAAKKDSFSCWGRKIKLGNTGLISSIISAGKEILNGPVQFRLNGKDISFKADLIKKNNSQAEYLLTPVNASFPLKIRLRAEFDGLLWFTVHLPAGKEIRSAELLLPLDRQFVDAYDDCASIFYRYDVNKRNKSSYLQNPAENPYFWLGNYDRGIMGGHNNMRGWYLKNKNKGYQLQLDPKTVCMTMRFIDTPLKPAGERSFSFYLQPTPVRPLRSAQLRKIRMENNPFSPEKVPYINANLWQPYYTDLFDHKSGKFMTSSKALERYRTHAASGKWNVFWYCAPKGTSPYSYEWNYFGEDWVEPDPALGNYRQDLVYNTREERIKGIWMNACLESRSFFNFKLRQIQDFVETEKFHAYDLYFDLGWPRKCGNTFHGCAWVDEFGYQHKNLDLLAMREFNLRTARMLQKKRPSAMLLGHLQQTRTPADSFYDILICAEPYNHRIYLNGGTYYDILTPELARIAYGYRAKEMLVEFGPNLIRPYSLFAPGKLKTYDARKPENDRAILHLLGYVMTHGWETCEMYPGHGTSRFFQWRKAQDFVGWDENIIFYPYWVKSRRPAFAVNAPERVMVSSYVNPKTGKAVIAVLNDLPRKTACRLILDPRALTGKNRVVCRSVFENKDFAPAEKVLDLELQPRQFVMLTVR